MGWIRKNNHDGERMQMRLSGKAVLSVTPVILLIFLFSLEDNAFAFRSPEPLVAEQIGQAGISSLTATSPAAAVRQFTSLQPVVQQNLNRSISADPVQNALQLATDIMNGSDQQNLMGTKGSASAVLQKKRSKALLRKSQQDELGFQHIRMSQQYLGIPVIGAELIVHVNDQDQVYMVNGSFQPDTAISIDPLVTAEQAARVGLVEQQGRKNMRLAARPALVIYNGRLAWYYVIKHGGKVPGMWLYSVDAQTGELLNRYNNIQFAAPVQGSGMEAVVSGQRLVGEDGTVVSMQGFWESNGNGRYFLYSFTNLWGIYDEDAADWQQQTTSTWASNDPPAVSCALNMEYTQDFVATVLGRNSFDNNGAFAKATVHGGTNLVNAYWTGNALYFGDGDGVTAAPLTSLDVVAHEYGHALTQYTSHLNYQNESGALNEAYSDIHATAVEFASQDDGTAAYPGVEAGKADWLIGEDCWLESTALRDMRNPQRYNHPSYYHGTYWYFGTGDNGGVHYNSGVANFAFYLLAMGGNGSNDGHPYSITGIGIQEAAAVALRANYFYHTSTAQYADARTAWIQAAYDLGYDFQTVAAVWTACGVDGSVPCNKRYTYDDTVTYNFDDISSTGTALNLANDQYSFITLPFTFSYYCGEYSSFAIQDNGIITFENNAVSSQNTCISGSRPPFIAPFWDDLNPDATDAELYYQIKGIAPNRRLIVQWQNLAHTDLAGTDRVTFQAILYERNSSILFQYRDVNLADPGYDNGASATVGLQFEPTANTTYSCNTATLSDGMAILFRQVKANRFLLSPVYFLLLPNLATP
jgi:Zn-dependent metalloprotease